MKKFPTLYKRRLHWNMNMLALMVKGIKQDNRTLTAVAQKSMVRDV